MEAQATPSPSHDSPTTRREKDIGVQEHNDIWDDTSDDPGHESTLTREWIHRQNQFHKMGYRDGITEGQKDSAQEGFNIGFRQSVQDGHRWGRVRGITSVLASLPDSLREKMVPDIQCRGELQDLHSSVQEISADGALQLFQNYLVENSCPGEEQQMMSEVNKPVDSVRLGSISKDLALLLHGCPDIKVDMASFEMTRSHLEVLEPKKVEEMKPCTVREDASSVVWEVTANLMQE